MNKYLIGGAMIAATLAIIYAGSARAEPPNMGSGAVMLIHPFPMCLTHDAAMEVVKAARKGDGMTKLTELNKQVNETGMPQCSFGIPPGPIVFGDSEDEGDMEGKNGTGGDAKIHVWLSHVGNIKFDFFLLYVEKVADETPT
jgi:hypothetical protein